MTHYGEPEASDYSDDKAERCIGCEDWTDTRCFVCNAPVCDNCDDYHQDEKHPTWRCEECGHGNIDDQDASDKTRCEPCAEDNRKFLATQKRRDDLEGAADYENDLRKDER